jgi:hypothetical protein
MFDVAEQMKGDVGRKKMFANLVGTARSPTMEWLVSRHFHAARCDCVHCGFERT